jgi:hypothetical protein
VQLNQESKELLYDAIKRIHQELALIRSGLDVYKLIGLNQPAINARGRTNSFFGFIQLQSHWFTVLGLEKVYQRETEDENKRLCSIRGIFRLAQETGEQDIESERFVAKHGVAATSHWISDVEAVLAQKRTEFGEYLVEIKKFRNQRVAHLALNYSDQYTLPGIDACEQMLQFADEFRAFIASEFMNAGSTPIGQYRRVHVSTINLLKAIGIENPIVDFPD